MPAHRAKDAGVVGPNTWRYRRARGSTATPHAACCPAAPPTRPVATTADRAGAARRVRRPVAGTPGSRRGSAKGRRPYDSAAARCGEGRSRRLHVADDATELVLAQHAGTLAPAPDGPVEHGRAA